MGYSINSKLSEILDDPQACAVIDKYVPGFQSNPLVGMAKGLTLKEIQEKSQGLLKAEFLEDVDKDLKALG